MTESVTPPETTERTESSTRPSDAADPATNRPMAVEEIRSAYADYADWMDRFDWFDRVITGRYRQSQFGDVEGRVLDVACGTGTNFPYMPDDVDLVGVDISPEMLEKAEDRLDEVPVDGRVEAMDAQALDFEDDSFDAVVSALSTCTFPDPVAALREMERVCKPDGEILLVEHGRSDVRPIAWFQEWREDAHYAQAGCRWTQEPLEVAKAAGLSVQATTTGLFGMITTIEAHPE